MAIKNYKPTTPGRRGMSVIDYTQLSKVAPEKSLLAPKAKKAGRNSYGRITIRHRGGGNRQKYRIIDFKRNKLDVAGTVMTLDMILTAALISRWFSTRMARSATSSLPPA